MKYNNNNNNNNNNFNIYFKSFLDLERMLINESDFEMKELYKNELQEINGMISELNDQLIEAYFNFRNEGINEVMIEIRAGKQNNEHSNNDYEYKYLILFIYRNRRCRSSSFR